MPGHATQRNKQREKHKREGHLLKTLFNFQKYKLAELLLVNFDNEDSGHLFRRCRATSEFLMLTSMSYYELFLWVLHKLPSKKKWWYSRCHLYGMQWISHQEDSLHIPVKTHWNVRFTCILRIFYLNKSSKSYFKSLLVLY